ncbi:MAG: NAD(P)H-hydrate dehydratase [Pseudomonadota bacterium]
MTAIENTPSAWQRRLPRPRIDAHKYDRGHVAILGSDTYTGATRLAAEASSRIGAGLVSVLANEALTVYQAALPADIMVRNTTIADLNRVNCVLAGSGGITEAQSASLLSLRPNIGLVLDAEAIPLALRLSHTDAPLIITPHEGEFARTFPALDGQRVDRAQRAAEQIGGICVLKGPNTIIATASGECRINAHASPWLAKAGTGDVLAGLIAGLLAQGMDPFDAASAAVWIHGDAGRKMGPGLTPPDMMTVFADILAALYLET